MTYIYASEYLKLLDHRNQRLKLNRSSLHADILKERHETGDLGELSPWRRFQDADVFLYLRSALATSDFSLWDAWRPWSAALLRGCPGYLLEAVQREKAERLDEAHGSAEPRRIPKPAEGSGRRTSSDVRFSQSVFPSIRGLEPGLDRDGVIPRFPMPTRNEMDLESFAAAV